ncbi:hypothetical protein V5O48_010554, partial [Marasmius crinis-equi]
EKDLDGGHLDNIGGEQLKGAVRYLTLGEVDGDWHQATSFGNRFDGPSLIDLLYSLRNLKNISICRTNFPLSQLLNVISALPTLKRLQLKRMQECTDVFPSYSPPPHTNTPISLESVRFTELFKHILHSSAARETSLKLMTTATIKDLSFDWASFYQLLHELKLEQGSKNIAFPGLSLWRFEISNRWRDLAPNDEEVHHVGGYIMSFLENAASELRELKLGAKFDLPVPPAFEVMLFTNLRKYSGPGMLLTRLNVGYCLAEVELLNSNRPARDFSRMRWSTLLRVLRLFWREEDVGLYLAIANACPQLTHLSLNTRGTTLLVSTFTRLAEVVDHFRHLETLELRGALPFGVRLEYASGPRTTPEGLDKPLHVMPGAFSDHPTLRVLDLQDKVKWVRGSSGSAMPGTVV